MHALALSGHSSESSHTDSIPQGPPHFPSVKNTLVRVSSDQYPLRIVALFSTLVVCDKGFRSHDQASGPEIIKPSSHHLTIADGVVRP